MAAAAVTGAVRPGLLPVHAPRGGGQIQKEHLRVHPRQPPPVQDPGRDGVHNELEAPQLAAQGLQAEALIVIGRRPGQVLIVPGGHRHLGP